LKKALKMKRKKFDTNNILLRVKACR